MQHDVVIETLSVLVTAVRQRLLRGLFGCWFLDQKNGEIVFDIFKELAKTYHQALPIVTHDNDFAAKIHRIIENDACA